MKLGLSSASQTPIASPSPKLATSVTPTPKAATASASTKAVPAKPYLVVKDTPTGFLRVRMDPSTGATEAGRINPGDTFSILDTQSGWYEIRFDGANTGWVSGQYVTTVE